MPSRHTNLPTQIAEALRYEIGEGHYPSHRPLPSYRRIAKEHGVSLTSVVSAMGLLEEQGLIDRQERRGVFVRQVTHLSRTEHAPCRLRCVTFVVNRFPIEVEHMRSAYLSGYTDAMEHSDAKMRFAVLPENKKCPERLFSSRMSLQPQGCVVVNAIEPALFDWLHDHNIPFVVQMYGRYMREGLPDHHSVCVNKYKGAFQATEYLLSLGHRRIAFAGGVEDRSAWVRSVVYQGYCAALNCAGLTGPGDVLDFHTEEAAAIVGLATDFLDRESRPTAILTANDATALGLLQAARNMGIRAPEELSIVGFNDEPEAAQADPSLTTVSNPRRTLARKAVEMLLDAAEGKHDSYQSAVLDCRLIIRNSAAPPAA